MSLKKEKFPEQKHPLVEAILEFGSVNRFAKSLGISRQVVNGWLHISALAPPVRHCKTIEELTGGKITRSHLRPDIFGGIEADTLNTQQKIEKCIIILNGLSDEIDSLKRGG